MFRSQVIDENPPWFSVASLPIFICMMCHFGFLRVDHRVNLRP